MSFFLHKLLPQPRTALNKDLEKAKATDKSQKTQEYDKTKMAQAAARLMVCLVARTGEGRRQIITDLVFALSCGQISLTNSYGSVEIPQQEALDTNAEIWALKLWGELCVGLLAPRSSNVLTSQDSNSVLSFEVVKLMLESGAAHALMMAIERIDLHHPMASNVASTLVRPLEILTRGSVYKTVSEMAEKDKAKLEASKMGKESRRGTFGPDDAAIENAFDAEAMDEEDNDESVESLYSDSSGSDGDELEVPPIDYAEDDGSEGSEDEDVSDDDSNSVSEDDMEEDESVDESSEEDAEDDEDELSNGGEDVEEEWGAEAEDDTNADFEAAFEGINDEELNDTAREAEARLAGGNEVGDGWTRVERGGGTGGANLLRGAGGDIGEMLLGMMQGQLGGGNGGRQANGGFLRSTSFFSSG